MIDRIVVWALTLRERARSEHGQDIMEYAILTGTIAAVLALALAFFVGSPVTGEGPLKGFFNDLGVFLGKLAP